MTGVASLPMYDWPEVRAEIDGFFARLRDAVPELPEGLAHFESEAALEVHWRDPALVLSQTCWGPMCCGLARHVAVLAQPSYDDVPGGRGVRYRSAIVMRDGEAVPSPAQQDAVIPEDIRGLRPAINGPKSLSGALSLAEDFADPSLPERALVTGSHRASIRAVAEDRADFAAIDCRTWALARAHEPAAQNLTVVGWTALRPGLPFITSRSTPPALRSRLAEALIALGAERPALAA
jgi:ABC-type phosphate/phosphonate transport system substrate-binding protein